MAVEEARRIPWPWLLLGAGLLALGRYLLDETTTETPFRVGLGLVAIGGGWIFAKSILLRPDRTLRVERSSEAAAREGERFSLPPSRFTLPPGSLEAPAVEPSTPSTAAAPAPAPSTPAPSVPMTYAGYVAPPAAPNTLAAPVAASFEDPDATWMVKAEDVPE